MISFAELADGKLAVSLLETEVEDAYPPGDASKTVKKCFRRAQLSIGAAILSTIAGMFLSALAVQGYKSFLPYAILLLSAAATWRLLATTRSLETRHARQQ